MLRVGQARGWLRFVDADQVAAITPGYVKCTFEMHEVANLPVPDGPPVFHPDMDREEHAADRASVPPVVRPVVRPPALGPQVVFAPPNPMRPEVPA